MKIILPVSIDAAKLTATNVPITETEWSAGTHTTGTQRYVGEDLYEVVASPSTVTSPTAGVLLDPPTWIKVGKINRFKMFDGILGDATVQNGSTIELTIAPGSLVTSVALFGLRAQSVQVIVEDPVEGEVYNRTIDLTATAGIDNWYLYFFEPIDQRTEALFEDLPSYLNATIQIVITRTSGNAEVGEIFLGRLRSVGATIIDTRVGIEDFSRKERDVFGRFDVVERRFAKLAFFNVLLSNDQVQAAVNILSARRALPTVYIGDEDKDETLIVGFYRTFTILREAPTVSELSIEIEGLV